MKNERIAEDEVRLGTEVLTGSGATPRIIMNLGELNEGAVVLPEGFACLFGRHHVSVTIGVERQNLLPLSCVFGKNAWHFSAGQSQVGETLQ